MYLKLEEYAAMGGEALSATDYARYEYQARKAIDLHTFGRVKADDPQREAVQRLMYGLITLYGTNEMLQQQEASGGVTSWANDGVSSGIKQVASFSPADLDAQAADLIWRHLSTEADSSGTPLMFRGAGSICR